MQKESLKWRESNLAGYARYCTAHVAQTAGRRAAPVLVSRTDPSWALSKIGAKRG